MKWICSRCLGSGVEPSSTNISAGWCSDCGGKGCVYGMPYL